MPWPDCAPCHSLPDGGGGNRPPSGQPNVPANSRQSGLRVPLAASSPRYLALTNIRRRSQSLPAATEDRHRPPSTPNRARTIALPCPYRPFRCCIVIPSVDLGLAEKERRSGSMRTVRAYSGMLYRFFGNVGKQPDQVTSPEVFGYAHGIGLSGKEPSSVTINARIACLSSFYRFLIRMSLVSANPCDQLERPRATPAPPRGLTAADIKKLLDFIPDNPVGLRDRAIILTLILTGRRRAEVLNLKVSDLIQDGEAVYYSYRGKGGKHGKRELPQPAFRAIQQALAAFGKDFSHAMKPEESLWPSSADSGRGITSGTFYGNHAPVLQGGGAAASRRPHLPSLGSQTAT